MKQRFFHIAYFARCYVYGGNIYVTVESTDDTKIIAQMVNQFKPNTGTVTFNKGDEEAKLKEL
ncbi:MAG: hypothetical protein LBG96_07565, partial [Tannerella sp.]|nr:hypothetical protein [Tannerella sp.]